MRQFDLLYSLDLLPDMSHVGVCAMHLIVFARRRSFTTFILVLSLAIGGVLALSKVLTDSFPLLKTPKVYADSGSIAMRAEPLKGYLVGRFESYFQKQNEQTKQGHGHGKIVLTSPKRMDVTVTKSYVCQIHSRRDIKIPALKTGYLAEISVRAGQAVKKGDVMFKIGMAKPKAKADSAKAKSDLTNVIAPFDGIVGRLNEQFNNLVKEGDVLTTLSDNGVMKVYFNVPEIQYLEYMANRKQHEEDKFELVLANETKFPHSGKISAIDAEFNNETGTIAFRADFPNPDGLLRHGQTGIILIHGKLHGAIVIPIRSVFEILDTQYVYVVDKDDIVHGARSSPSAKWMTSMSSRKESVWATESFSRASDRFAPARR